MRALIAILVTLALASNALDVAPEEILLDAHNTISTMQAGGANQDKCKKFAGKMCKMAEDDTKKDQEVLDKLRDGKHCTEEGMTIVRQAESKLAKWKRKLAYSVKKVAHYKAKKITFEAMEYTTIQEGKCGWAWSSGTSFFAVKKVVREWEKRLRTCKVTITELLKELKRVTVNQLRQAARCRCDLRKTRDDQWRAMNGKKSREKNAKAYLKCKMMKCLIDRTPVTIKCTKKGGGGAGSSGRSRAMCPNPECHGKLKRLVKKKLATRVENEKCTATTSTTSSSSSSSFTKSSSTITRTITSTRYALGYRGNTPGKRERCTTGFKRVMDLNECKNIASKAVGKKWKAAHCGHNRRKGCYENQHYTYYQTCNKDGSTRYNHAAVCKKTIKKTVTTTQHGRLLKRM